MTDMSHAPVIRAAAKGSVGLRRSARYNGLKPQSSEDLLLATEQRHVARAAALAALGALVLLTLDVAVQVRGLETLSIFTTAASFVAVTALLALAARRPSIVLAAALLSAAVQTTFVAFWLSGPSPPPAALILIEVKTALVLTAPIFLIGRWREVPPAIRSAILPFLLVAALAALQALRLAGGPSATFAYLRNFAAPGLILLLIALSSRRRDVRALDGTLLFLAWALTVATCAQLLAGQARWDSWIHLDNLMRIKGPLSTVTDFFGVRVPRIRSLVGEPINASYTFAALTWWAILRRRPFLAAILAMQNFGTFAKGGMIVSIVALVWVLATARGRKRGAILAGAIIIGTLPMLAAYGALSGVGSAYQVLIDPLAYSTGTNSAMTHAAGLILGLRSSVVNPQGAGTGAGGNFSNIFSPAGNTDDWISTGSESAVGVIAYQLGIIGLLLLAWAVRALVKYGSRLNSLNARIGTGLFVGWVAAGVFQENSFGPQAALPVLTVVGLGLFTNSSHRAESLHE